MLSHVVKNFIAWSHNSPARMRKLRLGMMLTLCEDHFAGNSPGRLGNHTPTHIPPAWSGSQLTMGKPGHSAWMVQTQTSWGYRGIAPPERWFGAHFVSFSLQGPACIGDKSWYFAICSCYSPDRKWNTPNGHSVIPTSSFIFPVPLGTSRFQPWNGRLCVTNTHKGSFPAIFVSASLPRPPFQPISSSKVTGIPKQKNKTMSHSLIATPAPGGAFK